MFGEGITNDAVSIILFNTVMKYTSATAKITAYTPVAIAKDFAVLGLNSLSIGLIFGLGVALITKNYRSISKKPIIETCLLFCFAYVAYIVSEMVHASGIITLLVTGILMAHYTWYNLSQMGK